jgi:hypothetical protein
MRFKDSKKFYLYCSELNINGFNFVGVAQEQ